MLADERLLYELRLREALELEILAREGGARVTGNTDAVNDALFKLLDTNGDGKLSKEELAAAPAVLLKRDRNDDEVITPDEIVPGVRVRGRFYEKEEIVAEIELLNAAEELSDYNRLPGKGPFWHVQPGASRAELARRLLGQYRKNAKKGLPAFNAVAHRPRFGRGQLCETRCGRQRLARFGGTRPFRRALA